MTLWDVKISHFYCMGLKKEQGPSQSKQHVHAQRFSDHCFHLLRRVCRLVQAILCNCSHLVNFLYLLVDFLHLSSYADIIRPQVFAEHLACKTGKKCYHHHAEHHEPIYSGG